MKDFICPFTNQIIKPEQISSAHSDYIRYNYYPVVVSEKIKHIKICSTLFESILSNNNIFNPGISNEELDKIKSFILFKLVNHQLKEILHWDCSKTSGIPGHILLQNTSNEIDKIPGYPKTRKQKADNILIFIKNSQTQDGAEIEIRNDPGLWGLLFLKNFEELIFYIEELGRKNYLIYSKNTQKVRLTFDGLDYLDGFPKSNKNETQIFMEPQYDVGLSFAGEERSFVEQVAQELKKAGVKVFYDNYEQADLWGKDLYQHLNDIYKNKCKFCIIFVSENYAKKLWTRHELKAAQEKAFRENQEYILPVKIDNTEIPGLNSTVGYLSSKDFSPKEIAGMAIKKLTK